MKFEKEKYVCLICLCECFRNFLVIYAKLIKLIGSICWTEIVYLKHMFWPNRSVNTSKLANKIDQSADTKKNLFFCYNCGHNKPSF